MSEIVLRAATIHDSQDVVTLNTESVAVTSPMDDARFRQLFDVSAITIVAEIDGSVSLTTQLPAGHEDDQKTSPLSNDLRDLANEQADPATRRNSPLH